MRQDVLNFRDIAQIKESSPEYFLMCSLKSECSARDRHSLFFRLGLKLLIP